MSHTCQLVTWCQDNLFGFADVGAVCVVVVQEVRLEGVLVSELPPLLVPEDGLVREGRVLGLLAPQLPARHLHLQLGLGEAGGVVTVRAPVVVQLQPQQPGQAVGDHPGYVHRTCSTQLGASSLCT